MRVTPTSPKRAAQDNPAAAIDGKRLWVSLLHSSWRLHSRFSMSRKRCRGERGSVCLATLVNKRDIVPTTENLSWEEARDPCVPTPLLPESEGWVRPGGCRGGAHPTHGAPCKQVGGLTPRAQPQRRASASGSLLSRGQVTPARRLLHLGPPDRTAVQTHSGWGACPAAQAHTPPPSVAVMVSTRLALAWTWRPVTQSECDRGYSTQISFPCKWGFPWAVPSCPGVQSGGHALPRNGELPTMGVCWRPGPGDRPLAHQDRRPVLQHEGSLGALASAIGLPGQRRWGQRGREGPVHWAQGPTDQGLCSGPTHPAPPPVTAQKLRVLIVFWWKQ
ncbi:unnamed protein product [Rangifer tarandus platyrhynchus]|uniref:Uncharacterized protein n=1 Tax=Rangifer tarandus platyrhynchus TaxID=3082113 RepID=A0ABN8ZYE7_RANTA|nr:unnamed protein product [Rangifer tarandus platyrhynchus]